MTRRGSGKYDGSSPVESCPMEPHPQSSSTPPYHRGHVVIGPAMVSVGSRTETLARRSSEIERRKPFLVPGDGGLGGFHD